MLRVGRRIVIAVAVGLIGGLAGSAIGNDLVNVGQENIAIRGYDPVAYFTAEMPVKGDSAYEHNWQGARWQFASAEHRDMFAGDPERFAPRYGGFCAGAMALGFRRPIDPEAWVIIDGKLYLNYLKGAVPAFIKNADEQISNADANWEHLRSAN